MSEREPLRAAALRKASAPVNFRFFEDTDNESADFHLGTRPTKIQIAGIENASLHRGKFYQKGGRPEGSISRPDMSGGRPAAPTELYQIVEKGLLGEAVELDQQTARGYERSVSQHSSRSTRSRSSNRSATRKLRRRAVLKNGDCNVSQVHISKRRRRYLQDIFTTLVDIQWRWTLLVFALSFLLSWLVFAAIWWLISFTHGDLDEHDNSWTPCVVNINSFTSCFLFSIETQHTIGYGSRSTTEECPEAIFVMCLQSITGVFIQAFMVGIVFAKMARPKQRTQTLLFSRNAVIAMRDGLLCLMFRVGDMREKSHLIGSSVRAQLVRPHTTKEGEVLSPFLYDLKVKADNYDSDVFLIWPTVIVHEIDSTSPLYELGAADMINERFEILVILEGTTESTGQTTQARTSYVASEILWGHRFQPLVAFNRAKGTYQVNFGLFHNTYQVDTPLCSARDLETFLEGTDIEL